MKRTYLVVSLIIFALLQGCASTKKYSSPHQENLVVRTVADSGTKIFLDIYDVNHLCEARFLGTVALDSKKTRVAIPVTRNSLLSFRFHSSSFWSNSSSSITYDTLLKPRKGHEYDIFARYVNDIYNVDISEYLKGRKKRLLQPRDLHECNK